MSELKPCPFCGDNSAYVMTAFDSSWERIRCDNCDAATDLYCKSENSQYARAGWNRRALDKELAWAAWQECDRAWREGLTIELCPQDAATRQAFDEWWEARNEQSGDE